MKKTVAVLFGGKSTEHEVSIITGLQAYENIDHDLFNPVAVYVDKDNNFYIGSNVNDITKYTNLESLKASATVAEFRKEKKQIVLFTKKGLFSSQAIKIDCALLCFHGGTGENGSIQGMMEFLGLPYTGCDQLSSSIAMDKLIMKQLFSANQIPMTKYLPIANNAFNSQIDIDNKLNEIEKTLPYPLFVKPANSGSSIGVNKVDNRSDLLNAIEVALQYDDQVIVEESFEDAREFNISLLGSHDSDIETSLIEEVFSDNNILDFDNKYFGNGKKVGGKKAPNKTGGGMVNTKRQLPAKISDDLSTLISETAIKVFRALRCSGVVRIDFLARPDKNEIVVIEPNTIPGSLSYYLWEASSKDYSKLLTDLISIGISNHQKQKSKLNTFQSNILSQYKSGF